jgi:uncharacterized protein
LGVTVNKKTRVIDEYLPTPLTEAEVADVADTAIAQVAGEIGERPTPKQMGRVMKAATAIAADKADGPGWLRPSRPAVAVSPPISGVPS